VVTFDANVEALDQRFFLDWLADLSDIKDITFMDDTFSSNTLGVPGSYR
jgi:hypothetical protein